MRCITVNYIYYNYILWCDNAVIKVWLGLSLSYASASGLRRAYGVPYVRALRRREHLYFCAAVFVLLCSYTTKPLVGGGVSMSFYRLLLVLQTMAAETERSLS